MEEQVAIQAIVHAPIETVWEYWTEPRHIQVWNAASDDWHTPHATNDLRVGGTLHARMEAKDGSVGFDFDGTYTEVIPHQRLAYTLEDGRKVTISFETTEDGIKITETFDIEHENSAELQRQGWQAILDNFKKYAESFN
jgi:uncharacterized protein YndB with AHSA1/START domain